MQPKLSIIIPCFNCEATLAAAVQSCFTQNLSIPFEIVLVDDGSTDTTREVMAKLAREHPEIQLAFHEKNRGGGATRNTAVRNSTGTIIFCLDSDDLLPEGTLEKMQLFLREMDADGVGIHRSIKFRGDNVSDIETIHTFGYVGEKIPFIALLDRDEVYCPLYSTFMITREAFDSIHGYPEQHGFDTQGMAWRFLASGRTAYTCHEAEYLHRTHFTQSYYLREAHAGKTNYNWQDIFIEHLDLFTDDTQQFILNFNCKDFTKNIFDELKKRDAIFKPNYAELLHHREYTNDTSVRREYIARNSFRGILLRLKARLKKNDTIRGIVVYWLAFFHRVRMLLTEGNAQKAYYARIEACKKNRRIVVNLSFGGIGDCLVWSTLPRLLKETYDIDFYVSERSLDVLRNKDTLRLCFEMNPYFKGIADGASAEELFELKSFEREKSLYTFITDKDGISLIEMLERQFNVHGKGHPELYYSPKILPEWKNVILIDENTISGKRFGWKFKKGIFENEAQKYVDAKDRIAYVDTKKQDLFTYVDMIYSCKRFVGTFSGGASIAAAYDKPFSVIWPYNAINGSNYAFRYAQSAGTYVK